MLTSLVPLVDEWWHNSAMDEQELKKALVKLRAGSGMSRAKVRSDPALMAAVGASSAEEGVSRIADAVLALDSENQRRALQAAFALGYDSNTTLRQRYAKLYDETRRPYETARKDADDGLRELVRVLVEKKASEDARVQLVSVARISPAITMDGQHTRFRSSFGPTIWAAMPRSMNGRFDTLSIQVEKADNIVWLLEPHLDDSKMVFRLFQRQFGVDRDHEISIYQATFVLDGMTAFVDFEMTKSKPYYVQVSDEGGTWHSSTTRMEGSSRTRVTYSALRRIRYYVSPHHVVGMDVRPTP